MIVTKKDLTCKIYRRLGKTLKRKTVQDVINTVVDHLISDLSENRSVSVRHFGTFSPYMRRGRRSVDVTTGLVRMSRSRRSVRFRPHASFTKLLNRRRQSRKNSRLRSD